MEYKSENIFTGKKIRSYRNKKKWMQSDLAEKIGVKGNTISAYERGSVEIPNSKLKALAEALEVRTSDLLPIEETQDEVMGYVQEAKSRLNEDQFNLFEQLLKKSLTLNESERENFFKNVRFAIKFFDEDKK